jgi:hypothetical protein
MALFSRRRAQPAPAPGRPAALPPPPAGDPQQLLRNAQRAHQRAEESMDREPATRARLENLYLQAASATQAARHPAEADAWLGLADVRRYQKGRRDDTLAAFNAALSAAPERDDVWEEYLSYVTYGISAPLLLEVTAAMPPRIRAGRIGMLLSVAEQRDRWGTMPVEEGKAYRCRLPDLLRQLHDDESLGACLSVFGLREEREGSHADAVAILAEAAATGHATAAAIDRLTVHLVKAEQWSKARTVLHAALAVPIASDTMRERLSRRLARCERQLG